MDFSIIIPTHGQAGSLWELLSSLDQLQSTPGGVETWVISNFSNPSLATQIARKHPHVNYDFVGERGVNKARNLGIRRTHGRYLLFLDDDCHIANPRFLCHLEKLFQENPDAVGIGGPYSTPQRLRSWSLAYAQISQSWVDLQLKKHIGGGVHESHFLLGGNSAFRRELFQDRIKFSEKIVFGGAETELHQRLHREGKKLLFVDELAVNHDPSVSALEFVNKAYLQGKNSSPKRHRFSQRETTWREKVYGFFFNLGRRAYESYGRESISPWQWSKVFVAQLLELDGEQNQDGQTGGTPKYHRLRRPLWKVSGIYHWSKAHPRNPVNLLLLVSSRVHWAVIFPLYHQFRLFKSQIYWRVLHPTRVFLVSKIFIPTWLFLRWKVAAPFLWKVLAPLWHFLVWRLLWQLSFPLRKAYYFTKYQFEKRILRKRFEEETQI